MHQQRTVECKSSPHNGIPINKRHCQPVDNHLLVRTCNTNECPAYYDVETTSLVSSLQSQLLCSSQTIVYCPVLGNMRRRCINADNALCEKPWHCKCRQVCASESARNHSGTVLKTIVSSCKRDVVTPFMADGCSVSQKEYEWSASHLAATTFDDDYNDHDHHNALSNNYDWSYICAAYEIHRDHNVNYNHNDIGSDKVSLMFGVNYLDKDFSSVSYYASSYTWRSTMWTGCSETGCSGTIGVRQRQVHCFNEQNVLQPDRMCASMQKPMETTKCDRLPVCPVWKTEAWQEVRYSCLLVQCLENCVDIIKLIWTIR